MKSLEIEQVSVRYGNVRAVDDVSITVTAGEVFVLLGANGAGKSSTLRAVMGLEPLWSGRVRMGGADLTRRPAHARSAAGMVLVPEGRRVFAPLTVLENLELGAYSPRARRTAAKTLAHVFEMFPVLSDRRAASAGLLSGGEQQMLAFGRALMSDPAFILMDEPSMGLAPVVVDQIMASARSIAQGGIGVLMVEQNAAVALQVADRGAVLERGRIALAGTSAELRGNPEVIEAFLGTQAVDDRTGRPSADSTSP